MPSPINETFHGAEFRSFPDFLMCSCPAGVQAARWNWRKVPPGLAHSIPRQWVHASTLTTVHRATCASRWSPRRVVEPTPQSHRGVHTPPPIVPCQFCRSPSPRPEYRLFGISSHPGQVQPGRWRLVVFAFIPGRWSSPGRQPHIGRCQTPLITEAFAYLALCGSMYPQVCAVKR